MGSPALASPALPTNDDKAVMLSACKSDDAEIYRGSEVDIVLTSLSCLALASSLCVLAAGVCALDTCRSVADSITSCPDALAGVHTADC